MLDEEIIFWRLLESVWKESSISLKGKWNESLRAGSNPSPLPASCPITTPLSWHPIYSRRFQGPLLPGPTQVNWGTETNPSNFTRSENYFNHRHEMWYPSKWPISNPVLIQPKCFKTQSQPHGWFQGKTYSDFLKLPLMCSTAGAPALLTCSPA